MNQTRLIALMLTAICVKIPLASASDQSLLLQHARVSLQSMEKQLKPLNIRIAHHPAYNDQEISYLAFDMRQVLEHFFHLNLAKKYPDLVLQIKTKDNYLSYIAMDDFQKKNKAYLAFQQSAESTHHDPSKSKRWRLIRAHQQIFDPEPFYLVWDTPVNYPTDWPFQVVELALVEKKSAQSNPLLKPDLKYPSARLGHALFYKQCATCHSLYYQGTLGKAPDLAKVAHYLNDTDIKKIVKNGFNYMPPIGRNFSEHELTQLLDFLHWLDEQSLKTKLSSA